MKCLYRDFRHLTKLSIYTSVLGGYIEANFSRSFFPTIFFSELIFMRAGGRGASPGNLSLLFLIVTVVALVLFRSQDVAPPFDKPRLIEKLSLKLYLRLHVLSQDCTYFFLYFSGIPHQKRILQILFT